MAFSPFSDAPGAEIFGLSVGSATGIAECDLDGRLLGRAYDSGGKCVFDLTRFWSVSSPCAETATIYHLVVYFLFDSVEQMDRSSEQLKNSLAIDAEVYHSHPVRSAVSGRKEGSIALLFSSSSPLVGPMTYGEVQLAAEHYLGWCRKAQDSAPIWANAGRVTMELVPRSAVKEWVGKREQLFNVCDAKGIWQGCSFHCAPPCEGEVGY